MIQKLLQFLIIFAPLVFLLFVVNVSFKLLQKPVDDAAPEIIKKIHSTYLVGIVNVFVLYTAFIFFSFHYLLNEGFIDWVFILANTSFSFIIMVMSADALNKINKDNKIKISMYKDYTDFLKALVGVSSILLFCSLVWGYFKIKKPA